MHEMSLLQDMFEHAVEHARHHSAEHITRVTVRIGEESGVSLDVIAFAFDMLTHGTIAEGAHLTIEPVPVVCDCPACRIAFHPLDELHTCPGCGQIGAPVRCGGEFEIAALEIS